MRAIRNATAGCCPTSSLTIAARHDLLVTGGSDWHGKGKPNGLGENLTDDDTVREILHRGVDLIGRVGSSHAA